MRQSLLFRLRHRDYRLTSQRRVMAQVLEGDNVHLTADEVHERARDHLPEISRATVYSTLHEWVEMGEIRELGFDDRSRRYDPNIDPDHHHLVCDTCGTVYDVQHEIDAPRLPARERHGMVIHRSDIVHRGTCAACRGE